MQQFWLAPKFISRISEQDMQNLYLITPPLIELAPKFNSKENMQQFWLAPKLISGISEQDMQNL